MESVDPSKFAAQASTGFLFGYEKSVRPMMSGVGQAGLRFGMNAGHPLLAAIGAGLFAIGELFAPNFEKLRKEVMTKSLHACDDFSVKTKNGAFLFIEKGYGKVLSVLLQSIESTVHRYDGIISKLVRSQKSVAERLEHRKNDLQSAVQSASLIKSQLENAARSIRATLQGSQLGIDGSETRRDGAVEDALILQSDDRAYTPSQSFEMLFYGKDSAEAPASSARTAAWTLWWSTGMASIVIFVFGLVMAQQSATTSTSLLSGFWARFVESDSAKPSAPPTSTATTTNASQAAENAQVSKPVPVPSEVSQPILQPDTLAPQTQVPAASDSVAPADAEQQIRSLLDQWVVSFKEKDLQRQVDCYAPQLDIYYRKQNVPQAYIQDNKSHAFSAIAEIRKFEISHVNVSLDGPQSGTVTFDKTWDTSLISGKRFAGSEMERLKVTMIDGSWRIASEEEVKIYYVVH
jgi:hypothetical protein